MGEKVLTVEKLYIILDFRSPALIKEPERSWA